MAQLRLENPTGKERHPLVLTIPGLGNSGPEHWQTIWEREREDCQRVNLGDWERPHRNTWVNNLNLAVYRAGRPVVLVAHSLGCLAVAWWAKFEESHARSSVIGALLVAPPEVDFFPLDERLAKFAPAPAEPLPFPSILAASRNDPYIGFRTARRLARTWGSTFADAGEIGHINAESKIGDWAFGKFLLGQLIGSRRNLDASRMPVVAASAGAVSHFAHESEAVPAGPGTPPPHQGSSGAH